MADNLKLAVEISADPSRAVKGVIELEENIGELSKGLAAEQARATELGDAWAVAGGKADHLGLQVALAKAALKDMAEQGISKTHADYQALAGEIQINEAALKRLLPSVRDAENAYLQAQNGVSRLEHQLGTNSAALDAQKQALKSAGVDVDRLADEYARLRQEMQKASDIKMAFQSLGITPLKEADAEITRLRQNYQLLKDSGELSDQQLEIANKALAESIARINASTGRMAQTTAQAGGAQHDLASSLAGTATAAAKAAAEVSDLDAALKKESHGADQAAQSTDTLNTSIAQAVRSALGWTAATVGIYEVKAAFESFFALGDKWENLKSRIKLASASQAEFNTAQQALFDIAQHVRGELEPLAGFYQRTEEAVKKLGQTQHAALDLTKLVAESYKISGASAVESTDGIQQLTQAFQSGVLSGDEFRTMMESSPRLSKALTDALHVSIGELRKMAEDQTLTTEVVINALLSQKDVIEREYAQMPATVEGAMQQAKNSLLKYIGELNESTKTTQKVAGAINAVGENLPAIGEGVKALAEGIAVGIGAKAVLAVNGFISALGNAAVAKVEAARQAKIMAETETVLAAAEVRAAEAAIAETKALIARNLAANAGMTVGAESLALKARLAKQEEDLASAWAKTDYAVGKATAATVEGTAKLGLLGRAIAAIPGWVKLAVVITGIELLPEAIEKLDKFVKKHSEAQKAVEANTAKNNEATRKQIGELEDLITTLGRYRDVQIKSADEVSRLSDSERAAYAEKLDGAQRYQKALLDLANKQMLLGSDTQSAQEQATAAYEKLVNAMDDVDKAAALSAEAVRNLLSLDAAKLIVQFDQVKAKGKDTAQALAEIGKGFDPGDPAKIQAFGQALVELKNTGKISAGEMKAEFDAFVGKLNPAQLDAFAAAMNAAFGDGKRDLEALGAAAEAVANSGALQRLGVDASQVLTGLSSPVRALLADFDAVESTINTTGRSATEAGKLLLSAFSGLLEKAKTREDLDAIKARMDALWQSGKVGVAAMTDAYQKWYQASGKVKATAAELGAAQAKAAQSAAAVAEAYKNGALTAELLAKAAADASAAQAMVGKSSDDAATSLQAASATEREYAQAAAGRAAAARQAAAEQSAQAQAARAEAAATIHDGEQVTVLIDSFSAKMLEFGEKGRAAIDRLAGGVQGFTVDWEEYGRRVNVWTKAAQAELDRVASWTEELQRATATGENLAGVVGDGAIPAFEHLDEQRLQGLQQALDAARQKMLALTDAAQAAEAASLDRLYQMQGDKTASENLRYEQEIADLKKKQAEAEKANSKEAADAYARTLANVQAVHEATLANIQKEQQAAQAAQAEKAQAEKAGPSGPDRLPASPPSTNPGPIYERERVIPLTISTGSGTIHATAPASGAATIDAFVRQLKNQARTS